MKIYLCLVLSTCALLFISCKKSSSLPTQPALPQKPITLDGYGIFIDSSYYELWSDSSWEQFNRVLVINGITYTTVINNDSDEYYYDALGYAGFQSKGLSLIIFDKTLPSLSDTVVIGQTYEQATTFFYAGYNYSLTYETTFTDTVSISVPIGIFSPCLWFTGTSTLTVQGQPSVSTFQDWDAKGPGAIKETLNSGITIVMLRGRVNGKGWGMPFSKTSTSVTKATSASFMQKLLKPLTHFKHAGASVKQ